VNATRTLSFLWTPWSISLSLLVLLATAGLCVVTWRRSGYRPSVGSLELLRFSIVLLGVLMLNQPEWVEAFRPQAKPVLAVIWDDSPSMETRDVPLASSTSSSQSTSSESASSQSASSGSASSQFSASSSDSDLPGSSVQSRKEAIARAIDEATWEPLREQWDIHLESFSGSYPEARSNLSAPLREALEQHPHLRAILLISDGDWNEGAPPIEMASRLRLAEIPVLAMPVGSPSRLPDIELLSLDAPTFGIAGKTVRIPFTIESWLPREYATQVVLTSSTGEQITQEIRVAPMGRTTDSILWKPDDVGDYTLKLEVPPHPDETILDNNQRSAPISIREERLRVLVVESYPRWEYRYLRNALSRDPGVDVSCLLFQPGLERVGGGSSDYISSFPDGLDELSEFDVVFLGDVGMEPGQLTEEQCRLLKGLVEHQASGLVFLPGWQGRQYSLLESELADLMPVTLDPGQPRGWGSRIPSHFELTELGRRSLLTKLADTEDENSEVWEDLPGFQWHAPVERAKAGSEILAVHKDASNQYGRLPLLVSRTHGAGKVLFMGTDGAWRWRKGVEDKYHYRFWGQVVRWMAYARNMARADSIRLYYSPDQPQVRQSLTLNANVMEASGEPLERGEVTARIQAPSGQAETIRLTSRGEEWGAFTGRYTTQEPGLHQLRLYCRETDSSLETTFFVQGDPEEPIGHPARPEVLEELARVTQGEVILPDRIEDAIRSLENLPEPPLSVRRVPLWSHPALAGLLVLMLGIFWGGRKVVGLI
jgi:hypothetical protein